MEGNMNTAQISICRFCNQTVMFESSEEWEDEDNGAAMHCTCDQALLLQRTDAAYSAVQRVCVDYAQEKGFEVLDEETVEKIKEACNGIISGSVDSIALNVSDGDSVKMRAKSGRVFVKRVRKIEMEMA